MLRSLCLGLVFSVALLASVGCACCRNRTACYTPAAAPCCDGAASAAVQTYSAPVPYTGH
jgi:hypothetical protein